MSIAKQNTEIRQALDQFDRRIEDMHNEFQKYRHEETHRMPAWENLERELLVFSRRKVPDLALAKQLDRVLFKFQTRKRIWLTWVEETQKS